MYIIVGSKYTDLGAKASDVCDGDITDKIVVTGGVDSNKAGTYTIKRNSDENYIFLIEIL